MTTVAHIEYVGDLAPYDYETAELARAGAQLLVVRGSTADELLDRLAGAEVIWLEWTPRLTREVLEQLPRCRFVMRWGVGYDQIDVAAATELGIAVANAPTYCTQDVAEHALALLLSVSRQVAFRHEQMRAGGWRDGAASTRRLAGSTVGVVGLGRIGRRVAELCAAVGATVIGYDPVAPTAPGVEAVGFEELLRRADYLTVHVPLSPATTHLFGARTLGLMKPGAVLVNTSRGAIVSQPDLMAALRDGPLSAAALDVFEQEPLPAEDELRLVPNLVLTPHEGSASPQALADLRREMCTATAEFLTTGWAGSIVNPEVRARLKAGERSA